MRGQNAQKLNKTADIFGEFVGELRWLWQYVRRYRSAVAVHILLGILGILMGLGGSVASKYLIDAVTGYESGDIGLAAALMIGMQLGNIAMRCVSTRVQAKINVRVQCEIQGEIYSRILATDWQSLEQYRSGDLLNRLSSDASTVSGGITGFLPSLISGLVQFFGSFAIISWYDPTMAVIALLGVPVSVLLSRLLVRRMRNHNREMKAIHSDMMSFQEDSFLNITSIKAFGITDQFDHRMREIQGKYKTAVLSYNEFSVRTAVIMSLVGMVVSAGCFGWGVYRLWSGAISYGTMTMFLQLASTLGAAFSALIGLAPAAISISTSAGRIMAVVELPAEPVEGEPLDHNEAYTVSLKHLSFRYQNGEQVLDDVNLTAGPGQLVALTGPSGEGKTTILRILLGLVRPTQGSARLLDSHGRSMDLSAATRQVFGYVPQGNSMFAGTIADNLRLTKPDATDRELMEVLRIACAEFVFDLPQGLQYEVGGRGKGLSEGQAQRIAVARALLRKAPILLLDEATSALDLETEARMLDNLMKSGLVRTCLVVTHRPGTMDFCNKAYQIKDGCAVPERI